MKRTLSPFPVGRINAEAMRIQFAGANYPVVAMIHEQQSPAELMPMLRFDGGLDVLYIVVAEFLLNRKKPLPRGFGLGVLVQGSFQLVFDGHFWLKCTRAIERKARHRRLRKVAIVHYNVR